MQWVALLINEQGQEPPGPSDSAALTAACTAALVFTPRVSVAPPRAVLLEVQASLRCFGGLQALLTQLSSTLTALQVPWQGAVAPTPLSAQWIARAAQPGAFAQVQPRELKATLSALPTLVLASAAPHQAHFEHLGLYSLGHLWRLPRSGLSRRFGPALLHELDRAIGLRPDPRETIALPERFDDKAELWEHTDSAAVLADAAQGLLAHLGVWLLARQALASELALHLHPTPRLHRVGRGAEALPIVVNLRLAQPTRDVDHLALLLRERLNRLTLRKPLPHPVAALSLHTVQLVEATTADAPSTQLFPAPVSAESTLARLVERLQARLGVDHVQGLVVQADHRPERATRPVPPVVAPKAKPPRPLKSLAAPLGIALGPHLAEAARPACLLPAPQALSVRQGQPCVDGQPLRLLAGPERIETGWWVDHDDLPLPTQRDYFVAEAPSHALLWVFCEAGAQDKRWFLHGYFG